MGTSIHDGQKNVIGTSEANSPNLARTSHNDFLKTPAHAGYRRGQLADPVVTITITITISRETLSARYKRGQLADLVMTI